MTAPISPNQPSSPSQQSSPTQLNSPNCQSSPSQESSPSQIHVGQVGNLRPNGNRPAARPEKFLRRRNQSGPHRIHLDITHNPTELRRVANQVVVALILPERLAGASENPIAFTSRKSLKRLHDFRYFDQRRDQQMNMVGHHHPGMQFVMPLFPAKNGFDHNGCDLGSAKKARPGASVVKKRIHRDESLSRRELFGKAPSLRQRPVQTPGEKDCLASGIPMRKMTTKGLNHTDEVAAARNILMKFGRPITNRPQVTNLPHVACY